MSDDKTDADAEKGAWHPERGDRVLQSETSRKLDRFLSAQMGCCPHCGRLVEKPDVDKDVEIFVSDIKGKGHA